MAFQCSPYLPEKTTFKSGKQCVHIFSVLNLSRSLEMGFKILSCLYICIALVSVHVISFHQLPRRSGECNFVGLIETNEPSTSSMNKSFSSVAKTSLDKMVQAFVISSRQSHFETFLHRNQASLSNNISLTWFPASNGRDQTVLDEFAHLTSFPPLNASLHYDRDNTISPHHTGCFMSHWNVLRLANAGWKALQSTPSALLIFEYDAICAASVLDTVTQTLPSLPADWDMMFVGGKPFSYYYPDLLSPDKKDRRSIRNFTDEEFERISCEGGFGGTATGPFSPNGDRNLSLNQSYWQIKYITNTHAYIVNPKRIDHVLEVLEHPPQGQVPIDIMFAEAARRDALKIYMTTMEQCVQKPKENDSKDGLPRIWKGYYCVRGLQNYRWNDIFFPECPSKA